MNNLMHTENGKHLLETTETIVEKNSLQRVNSTKETNAPTSKPPETKIQQPLHPERSNRYKMVKIQENLEDENEVNACETGGEKEITKIEVSLNQSSKISPPRQASEFS